MEDLLNNSKEYFGKTLVGIDSMSELQAHNTAINSWFFYCKVDLLRM